MKKNVCKAASGQTLVEFTIVFSLFLFLIFVVVDLGRAVFFYSSIHNAAREGARYAVIHPYDYADIETAVQRLAPFLLLDDITTGPPVKDQEDKDKISVIVTYDFETITPILNLLTSNSDITLKSQASMYVEN